MVTNEAVSIWCETCSRVAPIDEWRRKLRQTRVAAGKRIIGHVSTFEHRVCRAFTAVAVKPADASQSVRDVY